MPQIFKVGRYVIYFWSNENISIEPVHVHVSKGKCLLCNNNSKIPPVQLGIIMRAIEARVDDIIEMWRKIFGEVKFYC